MKRFEPIPSNIDALNRVQDSLQDSLSPLADLEILNGRLISGPIGTSGALIAHRLGRPYKGVLVVKTSLPDGTDYTGRVREITTLGSNPDDSVYIKMASTAGTPDVSLWVF